LFCSVTLPGLAAAVGAAAEPGSKEIHALLVNGRPAEQPLDEATGYLRAALDPFGDASPLPGGKIRTRVVTVTKFNKLGAKDLQEVDCVLLCDVPRLSQDEARRLEAFVRAGGGVVFFLGPRVDADAYNTELGPDGRGLLPARLLERREAKDERFFRFGCAQDAFQRPPFDALANARPFLRPKFRAFVRVGPPERKGQVRTVLSFEEVAADKDDKGTGAGAAILEWRPFAGGTEHGGRVVLVTTTVNREWNDWPVEPLFVPMAHQLVRFVSSDSRRR
jgi:hypothetical protein